ncbi:MAG TPA: hypothetical protein VI299_30355, partial [Polyangiales bacterium]
MPVTWQVGPSELGTIDAATGVFKPTGVGGTVKVTANAGSMFGQITLVIVARSAQEGDPDFGKIPSGSGGIGGVGGEGGGSTVTDTAVRAGLDGAATDDASLKWLYPYDGTVWPRGLPAPLLMWNNGAHVPVAVKLHITVDD